MARFLDFGSNKVLSVPFVDKLQDTLHNYVDGLDLAFAADTVTAFASSEDPITISIDGYFRIVENNLTTTATGPSAMLGVYTVARGDVVSLSITDDDSPPVVAEGEAYRRVGEVDWTGSNISGLRQEVVDVNAQFLNGYQVSATPGPNRIPKTGLDGLLATGWFATSVFGDFSIGEIFDVWIPSGASTIYVPDNCRLMDGSVLGPSEHDFTGGAATITLPNTFARFALGANTARGYAATALASSGAAQGPGLGATGGSNQAVSMAHFHPIGNHRHQWLFNGHSHTGNHYHDLPAHYHTLPQNNLDYKDTTINSHTINAVDQTDDSVTSFTSGTHIGASIDHTPLPSSTNDGAGNVSTALPSPIDIRPPYIGLISIIKVL